jgi:hypothetical protein
MEPQSESIVLTGRGINSPSRSIQTTLVPGANPYFRLIGPGIVSWPFGFTVVVMPGFYYDLVIRNTQPRYVTLVPVQGVRTGEAEPAAPTGAVGMVVTDLEVTRGDVASAGE